uniref:Na(+)/H(+) exchange regulatory cofactor NHE-RF1 n=1 Tax=Aceria tosichella TaxID=561515 RepID=A0A6G1S7S1_9ACAR
MVEILPDDAPAPRLCHLIKWPDFDGYGFNLHAERSNPGQFIGKIDDQSPAQLAGLREGDRIIEVNGVNISNENHRQVVERIKSNPQEARLLVVDAEADAWYREQDLVVKSSQINVVYIKTPVPRPEPDSPRATNFHSQQQQQQPQERQPQENGGDSKSTSSDQNQQQDQQQQQQQQNDQQQPADPTSDHQGQHNSLSGNQSLDTSDFNEKSMEQHEKQSPMAAEETVASRISPPMSPDSGRGDEEQHQPPIAKPGETLTVEAEINHRRPPAEDQISKQSDDHDEEEEEERKKVASEQAPRNKIEALTKSQMDEKEQIRKLHNKSADSGKSSSPDATSSSSNTSGSHSDLVAAGGAVEDVHDESGDAIASAPASPSSNGLAVGGLDKQKEVRSETEHPSEQPTSNHVDVTTVTQQVHKTDATQELRNEMKDTQVNNNNNNKVNLEDSHNEEEGLPENAMTKIVTSSARHQKQALESVGNSNNNNNYSGLNLNMTASQMRELIASRKKFDPKKAQMNIRQKYEIIQQM